MKRREIKFVAGSLQLAPDRIETGSALRKSIGEFRKGAERLRVRERGLATRAAGGKRR